MTFQFPTLGQNLTPLGKLLREFHISRQSRDKYKFDQSLFSLHGNVVFANFHAVRQFVRKMNDKRDLVNFPEQAIRAGQINAMGLIDEILHHVVELYRQEKNPQLNEQALKWLTDKLGEENVEKALRVFVEEFPPLHVYNREQSVEQYLQGKSEGIPNKEVALEEMILLWLANANPAFSPYLELFDDKRLEHETEYRQIIHLLDEFFKSQPYFGPENQPLLEMLRTPAIKVPHSLTGQLEYILEKWSPLLGKYLSRLLSSLDLIKEEEKLRFAGGPGPSHVYDFTGAEDEPERFSPDKDWMPNLVLIAKSTFVWLDQLSKKYQRSITRLDEIPDEELDQLARWGFTGLWLIGIWERSSASKKIKQYCGNPEAESSAYSLFDYVVAQNLGGDEAFENLKKRCWQRGIRLASDMVPNHTGIYSRWIIEHPDWFIGQPYSPFPGYSFNGANLSDDPNLGIYIEDHYYDRTDAAVVFKRVDFRTGETRYIYHGNDGTSMPWNDTAQLNYLNPELREAV
ncbi:MAG: alpha-amylase, partial [Calditrichaeota bacterium]|nr:alpha-amylase [Calditrichota bacterium]